MSEAGAAVVITGVGGWSPVGATVEQTCAAVRAGINRFKDHAWYAPATADPEWDEEVPLVCSAVPGMDDLLDDPDRLVRLALSGLKEALSGAGLKRASLSRGSLLLALPTPEALAAAPGSTELILRRVLSRSGLTGIGTAGTRKGGQAAMLLALREAAGMLRAGSCDFCIVGGVDSWMFDSRLEATDRAWRLKSLRNADGFIPGEAAIFVVLELGSGAEKRRARPLCQLGEVGVGHEANTIDSRKSSTGAGLSDAIREAVKGGGSAAGPGWVVCDLNGESYRAFEWGVVLSRLGEAFGGMKRLTHPADSLGDTGSATGGVLLACAIHGFTRGYAPDRGALIWTSSDDGTRAALIAARAQGAGG